MQLLVDTPRHGQLMQALQGLQPWHHHAQQQQSAQGAVVPSRNQPVWWPQVAAPCQPYPPCILLSGAVGKVVNQHAQCNMKLA